MRAKRFIYNTLLLTIASLVIRGIGLMFQVYLSNKIGAEGIGLFQLIMSVQVLAVTFAVSGIRYAVCRLVSEEIGLDNPAGIRAAVKRCIGYALCFGSAACLILFFGAYRIGAIWVGDKRTVLSLRILAFTMPLIALSSVMGGYFTAVQRIVKFSSSQILEYLIRFFVVMLLLGLVPPGNLEYACAAVSVGNLLGEILSLAFVMTLYFFDVRRYGKARKKHPGMTGRMLRIALPMALSAYARTALGTLQHLLVPKGLQKSGASPETSLAAYGTISGMVLPVVLFPIAIFQSVSEMIVPDLTEAQMRGDSALCSRIVNRTLTICLFFSIGVFGVFFAFARELGLAVYKASAPGYFIRIFSPLVIVMYMDTVADGMLKGLGQQMHSMVYNIIDALTSVIMVYFLLPRYAVTAYVFTIFFTETLNFALTIKRLTKVVEVSVPLRDIVLPFLCIAGAVNFSLLLLRLIGLPISPAPLVIAVHMLLTLLLYYMLLRLFSCLTSSDVRLFAALFKQ